MMNLTDQSVQLTDWLHKNDAYIPMCTVKRMVRIDALPTSGEPN